MKVQVTWFKESGKWYASGNAWVTTSLVEVEQLKQDIVNTQDALFAGWVGDDFYVVVKGTEDQEEPLNCPFVTWLFKPRAFVGMHKTRKIPATALSHA